MNTAPGRHLRAAAQHLSDLADPRLALRQEGRPAELVPPAPRGPLTVPWLPLPNDHLRSPTVAGVGVPGQRRRGDQLRVTLGLGRTATGHLQPGQSHGEVRAAAPGRRRLIDHLDATYDVHVGWAATYAGDFRQPPHLERVARITPNDPAAAPLTIGFTNFPGIVLHAGLLHEFAYPTCGCDACDETAAGEVEKLESHVLAVVAGHYQETYTPGANLPLGFVLRSDCSGEQASYSTTDGYPEDLLATALAKLENFPAGWVRWPLKT